MQVLLLKKYVRYHFYITYVRLHLLHFCCILIKSTWYVHMERYTYTYVY